MQRMAKLIFMLLPCLCSSPAPLKVSGVVLIVMPVQYHRQAKTKKEEAGTSHNQGIGQGHPKLASPPGFVVYHTTLICLQETFKKEGLGYTMDGLTGNTLNSHRLIAYAGEQGFDTQDRLVEELFKAYFTQARLLLRAAYEAAAYVTRRPRYARRVTPSDLYIGLP